VLLGDARRTSGLAATALVAAVLMTTLVVGPFHLAHGLGLGAAGVGLAMAVGPAVAAFAGVPAGRLVDRVGAVRTAAAGAAAVVAGAAALAAAPLAFGIAGYVVPLVVVTAGYALFQAANNTAVMDGVPAHARGTVSGALQLARNLGLLAGASAMGAVFAWAAGAPDPARAVPAQVAAGTRTAFAVATALAMAALVLLLRRSARAPAAAA
jgi:MFS family permease